MAIDFCQRKAVQNFNERGDCSCACYSPRVDWLVGNGGDGTGTETGKSTGQTHFDSVRLSPPSSPSHNISLPPSPSLTHHSSLSPLCYIIARLLPHAMARLPHSGRKNGLLFGNLPPSRVPATSASDGTPGPWRRQPAVSTACDFCRRRKVSVASFNR